MATTTPAGIYYRTNAEAASTLEAQSLALANSVNNAVGLVPIVPSSVTVSGGSGSVSSLGVVSFSGVSAITLKNVFSGNYEHYKYVMTLSSASNDADMQMQFGKTGLSNLASGFYWGRYAVYSGPNSSPSFTANTGGGMFARISVGGAFASGDITGAGSTKRKAWNSISADQDFMIFFGGRNSSTTAYEDLYLYLLQGGTFTGTMQVWGYRG